MGNPYREKVDNFPGRLFPWKSPETERETLLSQIGGRGLCLELGSGSGGHLLERARRNPESAWVGFELRYKRAVRTLEKAAVQGIENAYILRTDGRALGDFFPPGSAEALYVNFPDPWEKERTRKNRILNGEILRSAADVLRPGGIFSVKTDHGGCFKDFLAEVIHSKSFEIEALTEDLHKSVHAQNNVLTEFEKMFLYQKLPIFHLVLRRREQASGLRREQNPYPHDEDMLR